VLTAAFVAGDLAYVQLGFDRAVDPTGLQPSEIGVVCPSPNGNYVASGSVTIINPSTIRIMLTRTGSTSATETLLDATSDTGIVAADGGEPWAGAPGIELPFP
jgi:hypothetical protein